MKFVPEFKFAFILPQHDVGLLQYVIRLRGIEHERKNVRVDSALAAREQLNEFRRSHGVHLF